MTNEYGVNVQLSYNRNAAYFLPKCRKEILKMMNQNTKPGLSPEADIALQFYRIAETLEELLDVMKDRDIRNYFEEDDPDGEAYLDRLLSPPHKVPAPDEIFAISIDPAK